MTRRLCAALSTAVLLLAPLAGRAADPKGSGVRPVELEVDASEAPRRIFHARVVVPADPGPLTLYFPKWIPGNHGPTGPISDLAGLHFKAGGKEIPWRRDEEDMYAFHCDVPEGAGAVEVALDHLAASGGRGGGSTTDKMAVVRWNEMLLYPKGRPIQSLPFRASLRLPEGWQSGTALPRASQDGATTRYETVSLETLIDSPVLAGVHFKTIELSSPDGVPHFLHLACDSPAGLEVSPETKAKHERLVAEAGALFGARHYRTYHFLVTLSNQMPVHGLEHHESSDNGMPERALVDAKVMAPLADLLPHEFTHSWCGKYRRPAGLVTADYQAAQRTKLLWVYEGLTQYLGKVLAARSGLWTPEQCRDALALTAQSQRNMRGRAWRPLEDTAVAAPLNYFGGGGWGGWRRGVDYYDESVLLWLEADTLIRQRTNGSKSLDDFCRRFFGGPGGKPDVKPYEFEDVVAALNEVCPHDWKAFWVQRLTATAQDAPLAGLEQAGWKLAYGLKPSELEGAGQKLMKRLDLAASLGLTLGEDGSVADVLKGGPADRGGVAPGMKLLAVNTRRWTPELLGEAVAATKDGKAPLELLLENGEYLRTYKIDYSGGARYARLERDKSRSDLLAAVIKPLRPADKPTEGTSAGDRRR
jgi:predicted metalloprotease with PDZ domain